MSAEQYPKVYLYRRIVQAKLYIDDHYTEPIDLNNIAEEAYFSKFHFIRLFRSIYGKTPHQYLTAVRISKAKQLLSKGVAVSDVCFSVGFESLGSFSSLFKNMVGRTPSAFLSEQLSRQLQITNNPLRYIPGCMAYKNGWIKK